MLSRTFGFVCARHARVIGLPTPDGSTYERHSTVFVGAWSRSFLLMSHVHNVTSKAKCAHTSGQPWQLGGWRSEENLEAAGGTWKSNTWLSQAGPHAIEWVSIRYTRQYFLSY